MSGMGDPVYDKSASIYYGQTHLSDEQIMLSYRNSWIAKKIIDIPALDALRKGRDWQAEQEQITLIEAEEKRLNFWNKIVQCKTLARLWGGAAIFIGTKDVDISEPFDVESVQKGGINYLTVLSRRELIPMELERDPLSEFYGQPKAYQVSGENQFLTIHPSRLVIQIGNCHPDPWNAVGTSHGWGDSVLQSVYVAMQNADSTAANISSLVFEANVDVFGIPGLMEHLATEEYRTKLLDRLTLASAGKSITKSLVRDAEEEYDRHSASFASLPDVMQTFLLMVSGAADIPLTRFIGQSPSGLSSSGEGDMKNYYDRVTAIQSLEIQPSIWKLDEALIRSALGNRPPEIFYEWTPLEQLSEKDQSDIGLKHAQAAEALMRTGLFDPNEMRTSVSNQLIETGFYPGLAEAMIENEGEFDPDLGETEEIGDAKPMTLYLRRDVLNAEEIIAWYKGQGLKQVYDAESMHVTIIYSKAPVDWMKIGEPWESILEVNAGGPRLHETFGDGASVLALLFSSRELDYRHRAAIEAGATHDYDYQSHISITLEAEEIDPKSIEPWQGKIVLGPEIYQEISSGDWREKVKASDAKI